MNPQRPKTMWEKEICNLLKVAIIWMGFFSPRVSGAGPQKKFVRKSLSKQEGKKYIN